MVAVVASTVVVDVVCRSSVAVHAAVNVRTSRAKRRDRTPAA
jgi:hypothetical protein